MRIWSILLIKSEINGVYILVEVSFNISTTFYLDCWISFRLMTLVYVELNSFALSRHSSFVNFFNSDTKRTLVYINSARDDWSSLIINVPFIVSLFANFLKAHRIH